MFTTLITVSIVIAGVMFIIVVDFVVREIRRREERAA